MIYGIASKKLRKKKIKERGENNFADVIVWRREIISNQWRGIAVKGCRCGHGLLVSTSSFSFLAASYARKQSPTAILSNVLSTSIYIYIFFIISMSCGLILKAPGTFGKKLKNFKTSFSIK